MSILRKQYTDLMLDLNRLNLGNGFISEDTRNHGYRKKWRANSR